ncbi:MAG: hypothetical protein IJ608_07390 [Lachnospiraceae bacterium]|nr:hypothetical protein [Lachnospiraceae bacterium]
MAKNRPSFGEAATSGMNTTYQPAEPVQAAPKPEPEIKPVEEIPASAPVKAETTDEPIQVMDNKKRGPKPAPGEHKMISARLKKENYDFAMAKSGKYKGLTGYINYLIEQDRANS